MALTFEQLFTLSTALTQLIENGADSDTGEGIEENPIAEELLASVETMMLRLVGV